MLASQAPTRLWQFLEALGDLLALGGERDRSGVEVFHALQLTCRQCRELRTQLLDAISQLVQTLCTCGHARQRGSGCKRCGEH